MFATAGALSVFIAAPTAETPTGPSEVWVSEAALAALPEAPEKTIVLTHCAICYTIDRIVVSGDTPEGWADHINRVIR